MKKGVFFFLMLAMLSGFSQELTKTSFEKFKLSVGLESLTYPGLGINTQGYKVQLDVPIYKRLGATFAYSKHDPFQEYCGDMLVNTTAQYFTAGLNYTFFEKSKWTFAALAGFDIERDRYKELGLNPLANLRAHDERVHADIESHSETATFVEGIVGIEVGYQINNRLQLSFSSRFNTYAALRNSFNVSYMFNLKKKEKVTYFY